MGNPSCQATDSFWSQEVLDALLERVRRVHHLELSPFDRTFLARTLTARTRALAEDPQAYGKRLATDAGEARDLRQSLSIGYSEFFRNALAFTLLEQLILPGLLESKERSGGSEIRVWSAGCAAGQEAWSLAILLDALDRNRDIPVPCRILATDWSASDLALARTGLYSGEAVGNVRMSHLGGYFCRQGESYHIAEWLMERVEFTFYDLLDTKTVCPPESIFGNFDLVFCSNVLIYYRPEIQARILGKVRRCLAPGGYLVCDETEGGIVEGVGGFRRAALPAAIFVKHS